MTISTEQYPPQSNLTESIDETAEKMNNPRATNRLKEPADDHKKMMTMDDELRLGKEIEAEHQLGLSNWIPLFLVILPNLGAMFFDGEPESWRDSLIFLLIVFFLYKISRAPWQLYASARTTRILNEARIQSNLGSRRPIKQAGASTSKTIYPIRSDQFLTELKRNEMAFLLLATFSPALGILLLLYLHTKLDLGLDYLNSHSTVLYLLSSLVKPLGHLHHRLLQRSRYLQRQLQFPVRLADQFNETIDHLTDRLSEIERTSLSKAELERFRRTHIDSPLAALSDRLAKYQSDDELHQLRAAARLSRLEETLTQLIGQLEKAEQTLNKLIQQDQSLHTSPIHSLGKIVHELLESSPLPTIKKGTNPTFKSDPNPHLYDSHPPNPFKSRSAPPQADNNPGYFRFLVRLFNPFETQSNHTPDHVYRQTPLNKFFAGVVHDPPAKRNVSVRLFMWPIKTMIIKPMSLMISITTPILSLPLKLVNLIFINKPSGSLARRGSHRDSNNNARPRRDHHRRLHPLAPSSPPSSGSPVTSPDSSHSDLDFLLHHPPLSHSAKNSPIQWAAEPAIYSDVNDENGRYQDHLF